MRVIPAGFRLIQEKSPTKKIEQVARICYKSEDKICEGSDIKMVKSLLARQHLAMVEHASVCIQVDEALYNVLKSIVVEAETFVTRGVDATHFYLRFTECITHVSEGLKPDKRYIVSGNLRAWYEFMEYYAAYARDMSLAFIPVIVEAAGGKDGVLGKWHKDNFKPDDDGEIDPYNLQDSFATLIEDMSVLLPEERMVHETISVLFTVDRGVTHEIVRMRDCSFAQESTRYCNYSNDKMGNEITVIKPIFFDVDTPQWKAWYDDCTRAETSYMTLIRSGAKPQQARTVLPHSTKAEIVVTTNLREWRHILELRACDSTGPAHPQMKEVMQPLLSYLRPGYSFAFGDLRMPGED